MAVVYRCVGIQTVDIVVFFRSHSSFSNPSSLQLRHSSFSKHSSLQLPHSTFSKPSLHHLRHSSFSNPSSLHLCHSLFSNPSATLPTSQLILQPFCFFTYIIGTSPTSHPILQPFLRFIYATAHSPTLLTLHLLHKLFTYVTWRAAHDPNPVQYRTVLTSYVICLIQGYLFT